MDVAHLHVLFLNLLGIERCNAVASAIGYHVVVIVYDSAEDIFLCDKAIPADVVYELLVFRTVMPYTHRGAQPHVASMVECYAVDGFVR